VDVSGGKIQVQVHWEHASGAALSDPFEVDAALASPGIYIFPPGTAQAFVTNIKQSEDDDVIAGSWAQAPGSVDPAVGQAVAIGSAATIWCNGLGQVSPPPAAADIQPPGAAPVTLNVVRVFVGGAEAQVLGAASHPTSVGLNQIDIIIPTGVTSGDAVPIVIEVECPDGAKIRSRDDVTIAVRPAPSPSLNSAAALVSPAPVHASVLLFDDFNGSSLDLGVWRLPTGDPTFFHRTQIKPPSEPPVISGGTIVLQLDTFNPTATIPGDSFWGHEIQSLQKFLPVQDAGVSVKSRIRFLGPPPGGLVGGFFTYGLDSVQKIRDEIDFELLSNDIGDERILTNVYDDAGFVGDPGDFAHLVLPGLDLTQFAEYEIRWFTDRIQWYINGVLIREEFGTLPDDPSEVRLNLWGPDQSFSQAYDANLQPATTAEGNQEFEIEIDLVRVMTVVPGSCPADLVLANQTLTGTQDLKASSTATLGPNLVVSGADITVSAPAVSILPDTTIGGIFSVGSNPACP
jgi:uncharacterized protein (TIGR03437 family)